LTVTIKKGTPILQYKDHILYKISIQSEVQIIDSTVVIAIHTLIYTTVRYKKSLKIQWGNQKPKTDRQYNG